MGNHCMFIKAEGEETRLVFLRCSLCMVCEKTMRIGQERRQVNSWEVNIGVQERENDGMY